MHVTYPGCVGRVARICAESVQVTPSTRNIGFTWLTEADELLSTMQGDVDTSVQSCELAVLAVCSFGIESLKTR